MNNKSRKKSVVNEVSKKLKKFEKSNPEIVASLKIFDMSISHYENIIKSLEPTKTYVSNSTKIIE